MGLKQFVGKFYTFKTRVVVGSASDLEKLGNEINTSKSEQVAFIVPLGVLPSGDMAVWIQTRQEVK